MPSARTHETLRTLRKLALGLTPLAAALVAACSDDPTRPAPTQPAPPSLGVNAGANNRRILFASTRYDTLGGDIFSMNPDGSGVSQLTSGRGIDVDPAWSPDGKRVAFASTRHDTAGSEIYVMNANGSGVSRLTYSAGYDLRPTWSKDGKRIAFASTRAAEDPTRGYFEDTDVFVMNADGTGVTQVTSVPGIDTDPSWSPDGKKLAFVSSRDIVQDTSQQNQAELYVMNVDGSQVTRLTYENVSAGDPSWAPGGKQIALHIEDRAVGVDVFVVNADGTQLTRLTNGPGKGGDAYPSWSPDGKQIAFASGRDDNAEIYVMNADGTAQTRLTTNGETDIEPAWNR